MSTTCSIASLCWNVVPSPSNCAGPCSAIGDLVQDAHSLLKSHKCAGIITTRKITIHDLVLNRLDEILQNMKHKKPFLG